MGRIGPAAGTALLLIVLLAGCQTTTSAPAPVTQEPGRFEGEPIRMDAGDLDPRSRDYLARVSRMIRDKWSYPCVPNAATGKCDYKAATLVLDFGLLEDGRVGLVTVRESSGMNIYDDRAVAAVRAASPFPGVPAEMMARAKAGSAGVTIRAAFNYKLVTSTSCADGACD